MVVYYGLGEKVQLRTLLNTEIHPLEPGTHGWPHAQHIVSVHQPYSKDTAEPLTGRSLCASDLILHYKVIISLLEGTVPGRLGPHFHENFGYK